MAATVLINPNMCGHLLLAIPQMKVLSAKSNGHTAQLGRVRKRGRERTFGQSTMSRPRPSTRNPSGPGYFEGIFLIISARTGRKEAHRRSAEAIHCAPYRVDAQTIKHSVGNPSSLATTRPSLQPPFRCSSNEPSKKRARGARWEHQGRSCGQGAKRRCF